MHMTVGSIRLYLLSEFVYFLCLKEAQGVVSSETWCTAFGQVHMEECDTMNASRAMNMQ